MSNNCLVTKLKGTVDNNSLPIYNSFVLNNANFNIESKYSGFYYLNTKGSTKVKIISGQLYNDVDTSHTVDEINHTGGGGVPFILGPNSKCVVIGKYNVVGIMASSSSRIDLSDLNYANDGNGIEYAQVNGFEDAGIITLGSIEDIKQKITLRNSYHQSGLWAAIPIGVETKDISDLSMFAATTNGEIHFYNNINQWNPNVRGDVAKGISTIENIQNAKVIDIEFGPVGKITWNLTFDISYISNLTNINRLNLNYMKYYGDLAEFLKKQGDTFREIGLSQNTYNTPFEIVPVLDYWASHGKTTNVLVYGAGVVFNGEYTGNKEVIFSGGTWTARDI